MPKFQGQTDSPLKIKLASAIVDAGWGATDIAANGRVTLEVRTQWVSDGSDIHITIKDVQGAAIDTIQGKIYGEYFRTRYGSTKPNKTGAMFFEAELRAHGLKAIGPKIRVASPVKIKDCKWLDEKGQSEVKAAQDGEILTCQASVEGAPAGANAYAEVRVRLGKDRETVVFTTHAPVQDGKIRFKWKRLFPKESREIQIQAELEKLGEKYYPPEYLFSVEVLGVDSESGPLPVAQHLVLNYEFAPGEAGDFKGKKVKVTAPDGSVKEHAIPADGKIDIPKSLPGEYLVDNTDVEDLI